MGKFWPAITCPIIGNIRGPIVTPQNILYIDS